MALNLWGTLYSVVNTFNYRMSGLPGLSAVEETDNPHTNELCARSIGGSVNTLKHEKRGRQEG
jgi:hypothetical protein